MTEGLIRLRRSMLYTPGDRPERVTKAIATQAADMVVADLEDAVAPEHKRAARSQVVDALRDAPDGTHVERCVRINAWGSEMPMRDLAVVMEAGPDAIVLPKVQAPHEVIAAAAHIARLEKRHGIPVGRTALLGIIETAAGVVHAHRVARASPRLTGLAFGAEDLAADAGLQRTRSNQEVLHARSHVALAAAAAGIGAIDQVFVTMDDLDGLRAEALEARRLGYSGKMVIHPKQVAVVHEAFTPTEDEVEKARQLIAAVDDAGIGAGGVVRFEGRMVDVPVIEQARRVLGIAQALADRTPR